MPRHGDMPMAGSDMGANIALLEKIVADQRKMLAEQVNRMFFHPRTSDVGALLRRSRELDNGCACRTMSTLFGATINWGTSAAAGTGGSAKRSGGAGVLSLDYVGRAHAL